jgi:hypothetical protein
MATDFDDLPLYDQLTKLNPDYMSDVWTNSLGTFFQTLISYLTARGIFLPPLTTAERDAIPTPQNGQMIYNSTLGSAQYFKAGVWTSF